MTVIYAPGTEETDPKKQNMSLQAIAAAATSTATSTAANTANIATNTSDIAALKTGQIPGSNGTASASAGNVGEYIVSTLVYASRTTLVSGAAKTITSISLTAGDWDVSANVNFEGTGSAVTSYCLGAVSLTNNTNDFVEGAYGYGPSLTSATTDSSMFIANARKLLTTTTTIYLVGTMNLNSGTSVGAWGTISARRRR